MSAIRIENLNKTFATSETTKPLLHLVLHERIDWMHACGGKGRCTTCKTIILKGEENLSPPSVAELRYLERGALRPGERLACQVQVRGDISIRVPKECKMPHMTYLDD